MMKSQSPLLSFDSRSKSFQAGIDSIPVADSAGASDAWFTLNPSTAKWLGFIEGEPLTESAPKHDPYRILPWKGYIAAQRGSIQRIELQGKFALYI